MTEAKQFEEAVNRWMVVCPEEAIKLKEFTCSQTEFCTTKEGEQNLVRITEGKREYYHSQEGAQKEAERWFSSLDLYQIGAVFVYGVGLGYDYQAAKEWLREDRNRLLVFIEEDLEVIHRLFETELGRECIQDDQVWLQYCSPITEISPKDIQNRLRQIPLKFFLSDICITGLDYYLQKNQASFTLLRGELNYLKNVQTYQVMEYIEYGGSFFRNFYRNLLELPKSFQAKELFGKFENVPAIICGAGPSLEKNLPLLETLRDRAMIFAGGTAMNTVNANGFVPHFGVGIDPNWSQYLRIFMNQAYQVPYFYRNRIHPGALSLIHGEHLFVTGSGGHGIAQWFEEELGIYGEHLKEGSNVINFSLSIAQALGCNPIILVGLDLAYTDEKSYSPGVYPHPVHDLQSRRLTRLPKEQVVTQADINKKPVKTLWKWITESYWYTQVAVTNPKLRIINATEGGIGFEGIPNFTLEEVTEKYLNRTWDLDTWIHAEIQKSAMPETVTKEEIYEKLNAMKDSLEKSRACCKQLRKEFHYILKEIDEKGESPPNLITKDALQNLKELNNEPAFKNVLSPFNESFLTYYGYQDLEAVFQAKQGEMNQLEIDRQRTLLNKKRYEFLKAVIDQNIDSISSAVKEDQILSMIYGAISQKGLEKPRKKEIGKGDKYFAEDDALRIVDTELGLDIEESICTDPILGEKEEKLHGKLRTLDQDDSVITEQHYFEGKLHGPSYSFDKHGNLLGESWFVNGVRQGKSYLYYPSGKLFSIQRFRDGLWEGRQEFFYETGQRKSLLNYEKGKPEGMIVLYYPTGELQRLLRFENGKRNGKETVWSVGMLKEQEMEYKDDRPIGKARCWHPNGVLSREIVYDQQSNITSVNWWSADGTLLPTQALLGEDILQMLAEESGALKKSLESVYGEVSRMLPTLEKEGVELDFSKDLEELKQQMHQLHEIHEKMETKVHETSEEAKEFIWQTPEARREVGKQLEEVTKKMEEDIVALEEALKLTSERIHELEEKQQ